MATSPIANITKSLLSQSLVSFIVLIQSVMPKVAKRLEERLARGESPESILDEMVRSAQGDQESEGLVHLVRAIHRLGTGHYQEALDDCNQARQGWPEGSFAFDFLEAHALTGLRRYDEAFAAFEVSHTGLWPIFNSLQGSPVVSSDIEQRKEDLYKRWALVGLVQGLEGLLTSNLNDLEAGGEKVVDVLQCARKDGQENAVWSATTEVEMSLPSELQHQVQEFRDFVRLIAIEDPFEGLRALGKRISKVWPEDIDCVEAVREQRK